METATDSHRHARYVPALHFRWLTPFYDPVLRWAFKEAPLKTRLVELAGLRPGQRVLDVGCGTGTLTLLLAGLEPRAEVVGLDGDPDVLDRARRKASSSGTAVRWDRGQAYALPYPDRSFDVVVMSLVLHHLSRANRTLALHEATRVLRPGGAFLAAEFGPPATRLQRALAKIGQLLEDTEDGVEGQLPGRLEAAGLEATEESNSYPTALGTIVIYRSSKPMEMNP